MSNKKQSNKGSRIARRSAARLAAVQAVYQMKSNDQQASAVIEEYRLHRFGKSVDGEDMVLPDGVLFDNIVKGVSARHDDLREIIDSFVKKQNTAGSRPDKAELEGLLDSILLCGAYELMAHHDVDAPVIISDYLEVTHAFYEGGEAKLVNGLLDNVKKAVRDDS